MGRQEGLLFAGDLLLDDESPLGAPPLLDGAVLTVDRAGVREPRGLLELHVLAGPDCGDVHHLAPGEHGIGRAVEATVRVDDPDVSRLHAVLRVATEASGDTTVHDLGSTNGTFVDGRRWSAGTASGCCPARCSGSATPGCLWSCPEPVPVSCRPDGAGHLEVNRPPRHLERLDPVRVTVPPEPPARERGRFPLLRDPAAAGRGGRPRGGHRSPTYLVFVLLSPLMALGTFWSDRVGGRRTVRAQRPRTPSRPVRVDRGDRPGHGGRGDRSGAGAHPGPATLLLTATGPRPRLWERRRADDDALELRLGLGSVRSAVEVRDQRRLAGRRGGRPAPSSSTSR